ncbi:hypothetical protein A3D00_04730 [Candidatus Woesebacteria bacterium RIFCSPHIGHO2_02_FULL_38_9]|uniref:Haloacid dehalogenase n=1 Tax=Candidatus Woesebacteria bacterium RIFCSPHIGHO2_01_FULL_39_28 TaxID=1802496 RepID=A0A1F7YJF1_9BACT|nr:MAG: hypothetical protein A2627_04090 [Candidatus Woesebacteria bacterium RIFCSPHIGHO2_01_FULL_39_28]OGM34911.1 MAG: hypothetical protein A3D00_04730 [Candidatus Woesebacteria bacterium RIFCSPHIGHO2_02_FULL_38_9]OGM58676.1 MAG: hypothetical protein A3A50_02745 [Candidatus Woesebacteria bacterium RIFCSPLOWO2_01_FULL_38_20]
MKRKNSNIIFFDLGDTLIYRERSHKDFDKELIKKITGKDTDIIDNILTVMSNQDRGVYSFWIDNDRCRTIQEEEKYNKGFFVKVFNRLGCQDRLDIFIHERNLQVRYKLFSGTLRYLKLLKESNFNLGVATNGRPSRHIVLKQLGIYDYFCPSLVFISDEIGLTKPDKKFYLYIENKLGDLSGATLCDDEDTNLSTAVENGWIGVKIDHNKLGFSVLDKLID